MKNSISIFNHTFLDYKALKRVLNTLLMCLPLIIFSDITLAQFELPDVGIDGVDPENDGPANLFINIFVYAGTAAIWIFVVVMCFVMLKNIVKSVAKVRREEDGKWGDVAGEMFGNAIATLAVIGFGLWITTILNAAAG